jgi:hypothetical protein
MKWVFHLTEAVRGKKDAYLLQVTGFRLQGLLFMAALQPGDPGGAPLASVTGGPGVSFSIRTTYNLLLKTGFVKPNTRSVKYSPVSITGFGIFVQRIQE